MIFNESFDKVHIVKMHLNVLYINQTFLFLPQTCKHLVGGRLLVGLALVNDLLEVSENYSWPILYCTKPQKREVK